MQEVLISHSIGLNFLLFVFLAAGIWFVGSWLTYLADAISERYRLATSTVGLIFLALATSLPEVETTMTAAVKTELRSGSQQPFRWNCIANCNSGLF